MHEPNPESEDSTSHDQIDRETCYFCSSDQELERHHIFPRRYGGGDVPENLVDVCPECHLKLEQLYDSRFWDRLEISKGDARPIWKELDDVVLLEWDMAAEEVHDHMPRKCGFCERMGPFKAVTHQPSGHPAWQCSYCGDRDGWSGLHVWVGANADELEEV